MRRVLFVTVALLIAAGAAVEAGESRTYEGTIEVVWDHAVKAIRDVDFVLVDSDRAEHVFTMRTKSKLSAKKGILMEVALTGGGQATTVQVDVVDPDKAYRARKHVQDYFAALDRRLR